MAVPIPFVKPQWLDNNGAPLAGGQLYSYIAGTSTPQATYADPLNASPNPNPTILDAYGRANVFMGNAKYKFVMQDALGNVLWTEDNIDGTAQVNTILNGIVNPANTLGNNGDFYINTSTFTLFGPKAGGVWPSGVSMRGANGTAVQEVVSGTYTGGNTVYVLSHAPAAAGELLGWLGEDIQLQATDYTLSGATVTVLGQNTTGYRALFYYRY